MKSLGKVIGILNSEYLLIKTDLNLSVGSELVVFAELVDEKLSNFELAKLTIPKGKIVVAANQGNYVYLASTVTKKIETKTKFKDSPLSNLKGLSNMVQFLGTPSIVTEESPVTFHSILDEKQSIGLPISRKIQIGDLIASELDQ